MLLLEWVLCIIVDIITNYCNVVVMGKSKGLMWVYNIGKISLLYMKKSICISVKNGI